MGEQSKIILLGICFLSVIMIGKFLDWNETWTILFGIWQCCGLNVLINNWNNIHKLPNS